MEQSKKLYARVAVPPSTCPGTYSYFILVLEKNVVRDGNGKGRELHTQVCNLYCKKGRLDLEDIHGKTSKNVRRVSSIF